MNHLRHQKYKKKQQLNNTRALNVKSSPLELEKDFKPINVSINDMEKFEKEELTKKRTFAKIMWYDWYDWLINYLLEPIKKFQKNLQVILSN